MNVPQADIERWRRRLDVERPSVVLWHMATEYQATKSALGFFLVDLWANIGTPGVQAVWEWDFKSLGKSLFDDNLDELLAEIRAEPPPDPGDPPARHPD